MSSSFVVPGHGTVFAAPVNTPMPAAGPSAFTLNGTPPTGWQEFGEHSIDDLFQYNIDGGDATFLDTWKTNSRKIIYAAVHWSFEGYGVKWDPDVIKEIYNGFTDKYNGVVVPAVKGALDLAFFLLATDGQDSIGFYHPNTSLTYSDPPSLDTGKFVEAPYTGNILAADPAAIPPDPKLGAGLLAIYGPTSFSQAAIARLTITAANGSTAPSSIKAGSSVGLAAQPVDQSGKATGVGQTANATWTSADPTIAVVDTSGDVTGKKAGVTSIAVAYHGFAASIPMTVTAS